MASPPSSCRCQRRRMVAPVLDPAFRRVTELHQRSLHTVAARGNAVRFALPRRGHAARITASLPQAFRMLVAFPALPRCIQTIIRMAAIYARRSVSIQSADRRVRGGAVRRRALLLRLRRARRPIGAKTVVFGALMVYTGISILGYYMRNEEHFFALAVLVGMVQWREDAGAQPLALCADDSQARRRSTSASLRFEKFAASRGRRCSRHR